MKISQPIFGILVVLTKKELTKIFNEPGNNVDKLSKYFVPKLSLICDCEKKCGHFLAIPSNSFFLSKISDPENN